MSFRKRRYDPTPDDDYNPTNYDEKYVIPTTGGVAEATGGGYFGGSSSVQSAPLYSSPVYKNEPAVGFGGGYDATTAAAQPAGQNKSAVTEQPMVFALRSDANLYVYEYSDRLEYYRNTPGGMLLCNIENKRR